MGLHSDPSSLAHTAPRRPKASAKGNALAGLKRYVEQQHGEAGVAAWLRAAPAEDGALIRGLVLANAWYDVAMWNRLTDAYVAALGGGDRASFRPLAHDVAANDLNVIFKVLLKIATPEILMGNAPRLYARYFDSGRVEARQRGPRRFAVDVVAPTALDAAPNRVTCEAGIPAWLERGLLLTGAASPVATHRACRFDGARACEIEVTWAA